MAGTGGTHAGHGAAQTGAAFGGLKAPAVWRRESASDTVRALERMAWKLTTFRHSCASKLTDGKRSCISVRGQHCCKNQGILRFIVAVPEPRLVRRHFFTRFISPKEIIMTIKVGDRLPEGSLAEFIETETAGCALGPNTFNVADLVKGKKIAVFAVPGAFTPTCSAKHLPGYIKLADEFKAKGVDEIWALSVNDAFVMGAWGRDQKPPASSVCWPMAAPRSPKRWAWMPISANSAWVHARNAIRCCSKMAWSSN